ncbi:MAG: sigma-70 family RNA polymerase sigma factor [Phycisphaerales bacterium]|nr:MAG: sigma-70 family RNA polymerase sigma factor [Phycisphaerales bacterium]
MFKETKLLQASRAGDRDAFEKIVTHYQSTICAITFSGTGRLDASEELAQETFVNAWEHLHQLRDLEGFRSWLYGIARNALRNYHLQKKPASLETDLDEVTTEETQNPPEILMRKEERMMLERAITRLPAKYREPLVLFCRQHHSIRQTAEVLGLTEATVRTRLHRARKLLREQMAERLEQVLEETGPRRGFTKAVMVAIGGVPLGVPATVDAATSVASGHASVTGGISAVLGGAGVKIAIVAAVVTVGAWVYTDRSRDSLPAFSPADATELAAAPSIAPAQELTNPGRADPDAFVPVKAPIPNQGKDAPDGSQPDLAGKDAEEGLDEPKQTPLETIVTGTVLDRNTLSPVAGARVGFKLSETVPADSQGCFRLSHRESREGAFVYTRAPGYATHRILLRINPGHRQDVLLKLQPGIALVGTVVDPNQEPIENVRVHVYGRPFGREEVLTNDRGQFRVEGLNPDDAFLHVSAKHPGYASGDSVTPKLGRPGEEAYAEIVLLPKPPGAIVCGQVTNARSEPVAQATVGWRHTRIKTTTDREGRYTLDAPDEELPSLYVTHAEYPGFVGDVTVPPEAREIRLDVQLENALPLSGRIVDDEGQPVARANIGIKSCRDQDVWGLAKLVQSDAQGRFIVPRAPAQADYQLAVFGNGIAPTTHAVSAGQEECLIVVSPSARIYGRVIDRDTGDPISCFRVSTEPRIGRPGMWTWDNHTFASEEGHFDTVSLELIHDERLSLTIDADGYDPLTLDSVPAQAISGDPDRTVFRLQRNERQSTIYVGCVVDDTGQAIAGAEVGFRLDRKTLDRQGFSRVMTDTSGTYMISSIDPYEQIFFVRAPGYALYYGRMSNLLLDIPDIFADVVLAPTASISGYVWDELGRPLADKRVLSHPVARSQEGNEFKALFWQLCPEARTDETGYYQLTDLPTGEVTIGVLCDDNIIEL